MAAGVHSVSPEVARHQRNGSRRGWGVGGRVFSPAKTSWGSGNTLKNDVQRNAAPQFSSRFWWLKSVTPSPPTQTLLLLTIKPLSKLSFWIGVCRGGWILHLPTGRDEVITLCVESTLSYSLNSFNKHIAWRQKSFFFFGKKKKQNNSNEPAWLWCSNKCCACVPWSLVKAWGVMN